MDQKGFKRYRSHAKIRQTDRMKKSDARNDRCYSERNKCESDAEYSWSGPTHPSGGPNRISETFFVLGLCFHIALFPTM